MDHATQVDLIGRWLALYRAGTTQLTDDVLRLDTAIYTSDTWFESERRSLWNDRAVVACLTADVREPGDFVTLNCGGVPLLVIRNDAGALGAFVNVCRHRATQVVHGCGNARTLACPFHNWTYARDGRLLGRPRSLGGFDTLANEDFGLVAVPVAEGHGVVMVRPGGGAPIDIDEALGAEIVRDFDHFDLAGYHVWDRRQRSWDCNWKLILDTFTESYHVFALHGASVGPDYPGHVMVFDSFGPHLRIPVPRASILAFEGRPTSEWDLLGHATVQYHLSPNVMINHTIDHVILWRFEPHAPDRTVAEMTMYTPEARADRSADHAWTSSMSEWFELHDSVTADEDYPESERIQRMLTSGRVPTTVLGRNEGAVQRFHGTVRGGVTGTG